MEEKMEKQDTSIDSLFNQLKVEMTEYCLDNDDITLEEQIQYHIKEYKKYNNNTKEFRNKI